MADKKADSPEMALVSNTDFEILLKKIERQKQKELDKQRRIDLVKSMYSVYEFVISKLEMNKGSLSLKEFEAAEVELKKLAAFETKALHHRIAGFLHQNSIWNFYFKHNYFSRKARPFGWDVYDYHMTRNFYDTDSSPIDLLNEAEEDYLPTNAKKLYRNLLKKRGL